MSRYARDPVSGSILPVAGGGSGGHTILDEDGTTYPQRSKLQFEGCEVTDDAVNGVTVVKCEGGGSSVVASLSVTTNNIAFYGQTIIVTLSGASVATGTFSSEGTATIGVVGAGIYTVSVSAYGVTVTDNVIVMANDTYSVALNYSGLILAMWLTEGGLDPTDYANFAAVEADEKAIRKLMTIHAAVDYLATCASATDSLALSIINSDICAKWINLRDYALDTLYANTYLAAMMDTADKYFYGEWIITDSTITPPTWGAKGNVPVMTSNTAPYGTASAYQVFDGNPSTTASGTDFLYQATNPICVRDFICKNTSNADITGGTLQGSNDGSTWTSIPTPSENASYYLYHRVHFGSSKTVATVQFYGRTLKVSVPVMTSNTAPYGVASCNHAHSNDSYAPYKAFDGNNSSFFSPVNTGEVDTYFSYIWNGITDIRLIEMYIASGSKAHTFNFTIQTTSDGNTWVNHDEVSVSAPKGTQTDTSLSDGGKWFSFRCNLQNVKGIRLFSTESLSVAGQYYIMLSTLQFYGLDYSEYDWDTNHPRKYLYDHGVELETCVFQQENTTTTYEKTSDSIIIKNGTFADFACDFSFYDLLRMVIGTLYRPATYSSLQVGQSSTSNQSLAHQLLSAADKPYHCVVDVSAISVSGYAKCLSGTTGGSGNSVVEIEEMWLE